MAAAAAVAAAVGVPRRGLAVFGPPAEDLVGAVVTAATRHAWRGLIDFKPNREIVGVFCCCFFKSTEP